MCGSKESTSFEALEPLLHLLNRLGTITAAYAA
jgi:hypothetical protein